MHVEFNSPYGQVVWYLPQEAVTTLEQVSPEIRERVLEAFGSNITILCGALLKSFGHAGRVETLGLIMQEIRETITNATT